MNSTTRSTITTTEKPSVRVVQTVAAADDTDPATLDPPLHSAVDPSALDRLFADTTNGSRRGTIQFTYRGYDVTVDADGRVELG